MGICLVIKSECPRNGDPSKGDFCPHWWKVEHLADEEKQLKETKYMCALSQGYPTLLHEIAMYTARNTDETKDLRTDLYSQYKDTVTSFNQQHASWIKAFHKAAIESVTAFKLMSDRKTGNKLLGWIKPKKD